MIVNVYRFWVLALFAAGSALAQTQEPTVFTVTAAQQRALGIVTAPPERAQVRDVGPLPARVIVPNSGRHVTAASVDASVAEVAVSTGNRVLEGQVLLSLAGPEVVRLQQALVVARQEESVARAKFKADQNLAREGAITERRLMQSKTSAVSARSRVLAAESALAVAGVAPEVIAGLLNADDIKSRLSVVAPFDGLVAEQSVSPGERVAAGVALITIIRTDQLQLEIHTPVSQCGDEFSSRSVSVTGYSATGTIISVGCTLHDEDQGVLLRADLNDPYRELRAGQLVDVSINLALEGSQVWRIPRTGVTRHDGQLWLFELRDQEVRALPIDSIAQEHDAWLVRGNLHSNSIIATEGALALKAIWLGAGGEE